MPKQTRYALAVIFLAYGSVVALGYLSTKSALIQLTAFPLVAALQNHLMILHHEGAHGLLHPRRSVNDFLTNVFCGFPFLELLQPYREFHFAHHRHVTNPDLDPEIPFYAAQGYHFTPRTRGQVIRQAALDLSGYNWLQFFVAFLITVNPKKALRARDLRDLAVFLVIIGTLLALGLGKFILLYWLLPQVTFAFYFAKFRGLHEHNLRHGTVVDCTNDWPASRIAKFFYCPLNSHRHCYHHLHPGAFWFAYP